jgi:hypothetical protein
MVAGQRLCLTACGELWRLKSNVLYCLRINMSGSASPGIVSGRGLSILLYFLSWHVGTSLWTLTYQAEKRLPLSSLGFD